MPFSKHSVSFAYYKVLMHVYTPMEVRYIFPSTEIQRLVAL